MVNAIFGTNRRAIDTVLLLLRLALAAVIFPHGAQKLLGWFGGPGLEGTMRFFTGMLHLPAFLAVVVILAEFFGPILLVVGMLTRLSALAIGIDMLVAVVTVHFPNGFFANWSGQQRGEGIEYFIYAIAVAAAITIAGPGRYSLDARLVDEEPEFRDVMPSRFQAGRAQRSR